MNQAQHRDHSWRDSLGRLGREDCVLNERIGEEHRAIDGSADEPQFCGDADELRGIILRGR
jgi:hypothetical protein